MEEWEMSCKAVKQLAKDTYILIDMRDEVSVAYGKIPNALAVSTEQITTQHEALFDRDKKLILYCRNGISSKEYAAFLRQKGYAAYSLSGGYESYIMDSFTDRDEEAEKEIAKEIEKNIRKKYHKSLFSKFAKAINEYDMIRENDKIAVCISGGKDSMIMAKLFQELKRHNKFPFELVFLVMDPGYSKVNRRLIENNARLMQIPITVFSSTIFDTVFEIEKSPCYLCARMRRGYLYSKAKELGCNKIALGHHYDDVIETILMGMLYGAQVQTMMPKIHSTNFEGMELIRPMYLIREADIKRFRDEHDLHFLQCACKFTDTCTSCREDGSSASKRMEIKKLIATLKKTNPFVESNIFRSVENVNLRTIIAYKDEEGRHNFREWYDKVPEKEDFQE